MRIGLEIEHFRLFSEGISMASSDSENDDLVSISSNATDGENYDVVPRFTIDSETNRPYSRFNAVGTELIVCLLPPAVGEIQMP